MTTQLQGHIDPFLEEGDYNNTSANCYDAPYDGLFGVYVLDEYFLDYL